MVTLRCPEDVFAVLEALVLVGFCCFVWFSSFFNRGLQPTQFLLQRRYVSRFLKHVFAFVLSLVLLGSARSLAGGCNKHCLLQRNMLHGS